MIVTHSNKFFRPKSIIVGGIYSNKLDVPDYVISSNNVNESKKYWANPSSAAYYKKAKKMADEANEMGEPVVNYFPDCVDTYSTQLFFKNDQNEYIVHTPLLSCALVDEFTKKARRIYNQQIEILKKNDQDEIKNHQFISFNYFQIQPSGVTLGNRGELATSHGGNFFIKSIKGNLSERSYENLKKYQSVELENDKKYLYFYGKLNDANFNAGFISMGLPSLSSIGGLVESIEVALNYNECIPFAFGFKNNHINPGGKIGANIKNGKVSTQLITEEKKGSLDFVIVLDITNFNYKHIANELKKKNRLGGGVIFEHNITQKQIDNDNKYLFLRNCKNIMKKAYQSSDVIDYIIKGNFHPILCGFSLLEKPYLKKGARCNCKHAFSESLYLPIRLTKKLYWKSFFKRNSGMNYTVYS